ncbi:MAG TPA: SDR family oxidoreductase [Thermoguttaceae bacterium]|nr:SDR family oxidoreductase [Thermoguttaceae bacterium]
MSAEYLQTLFGLEGQTAVVIGGAGVLGGALCRGLVQAGARVIVADVTEEGCQARVEELQGLGGQAGSCPVDVTSRASIENLLAAALDQTGRVDILVNCAGVNFGSPFLEHPEDQWDRILTINLKAVFQACQVFGRQMVAAGGGSIVNIGSVTSHLPLSRVFAYSASKAAVLNLTRNVAQEFGTQGVRVNAICPGFFPAEQNRRLLDQERIDNIMGGTPMRRFGEPEELIGALLLLVSPAAGSFITGTHVNVDGGFTAAWF